MSTEGQASITGDADVTTFTGKYPPPPDFGEPEDPVEPEVDTVRGEVMPPEPPQDDTQDPDATAPLEDERRERTPVEVERRTPQ